MSKTFVSELPADLDRSSREARFGALRAASLPDRHAARSVDKSGPWGTAAAEAMQALSLGGAIVVLSGIRGCGKTQLATEAAKAYCRSGHTALYTKAAGMFLAIREGMGSDKSEVAAVKPFLRADLLVIDAMEERGETDWENRTFNYILDRRYDAMQDTILITNQTPESFASSVGLSVVSRIHECGKVIECNWGTFRGKV